jgi:hypothetical protein
MERIDFLFMREHAMLKISPVYVVQEPHFGLYEKYERRRFPGFSAPLLLNRYDGMTEDIPFEAYFIPSALRGCFLPLPPDLRRDGYRFAQWKGVGLSGAAELFAFDARPGLPIGKQTLSWLSYRIEAPSEHGFPLMTVYFSNNGARPYPYYSRVGGGAYYYDICEESMNYHEIQRYSGDRFRSAAVVATMKFANSLNAALSLPLNVSDAPNEFRGESIGEFISRTYQKNGRISVNTAEYGDVKEGIGVGMGQNIRFIRNCWRFQDLDRAMTTYGCPGVAMSIIEQSAEWLGEEFSSSYNVIDYVHEVTAILGRQVGLLWFKGIAHGALHMHKQDITLAGEMTDLDFMIYSGGKPVVHMEFDELKIYLRQVFLVAYHFESFSRVLEHFKIKCSKHEMLSRYYVAILSALSPDFQGALKQAMSEIPEDFYERFLTFDSGESRENLKNYHDYFKLLRDISLAQSF